MKEQQFEMVAKTFAGLEEVLAGELRDLGALNVEAGRRMVSFEGNLETMYRANLCCRTALRILKPIYKFIAHDPDELYEMTKEFDWETILSTDKTFSIDSVVNSDEFTHSRFVTYRVKDAIVDFFTDKYGEGKRPGVRLQDADVIINVHISDNRVTLSLDSSGESLHKRGYRVAQTEAPINEVLAAGILMISGWNGNSPLVDPMCGSGTFLIEAALIAANINPGVYRRGFAFEHWPDFDRELFEELYNDDSQERTFDYKIYGADMSPKAIAIARENIKSAGVADMIELEVKQLSHWNEAPEGGMLVTNPPYGERITSDDMDGLYKLIGSKLKNVFKGYHAWIIGYKREYFDAIGLAPSFKTPLFNGSLECELREYIIFEGDLKSFRRDGGKLRKDDDLAEKSDKKKRRLTDKEWKMEARRDGFGGKESKGERRERQHSKDRKMKSDSRDRRQADRHEHRDRFADREPRHERRESEEIENPLAIRRNEHALKSIQLKQPSLPPSSGPMMRTRGWKKKK